MQEVQVTGIDSEITPDMALQRLDGMINAKSQWLAAHASTRPEWEVGIYRLDKEVLEKVRRWFANGLEKKREREAS